MSELSFLSQNFDEISAFHKSMEYVLGCHAYTSVKNKNGGVARGFPLTNSVFWWFLFQSKILPAISKKSYNLNCIETIKFSFSMHTSITRMATQRKVFSLITEVFFFRCYFKQSRTQSLFEEVSAFQTS